MAQTIQNGIRFGTIYKDGGVRVGDTLIQSSWNANAEYPSDDNYPLINAVDIDWNGAEVGEETIINTTGELLNWIKDGLAAAAQSGTGLTEEQVQAIEDATNILTFMKQYVVSQNTLNHLESVIDDALEEIRSGSNLEDYATKEFVTQKISDVVGAAPQALDTLKEIADVLAGNDDANNPVAGLIEIVSQKANADDVYTKDVIDNLKDEIDEANEVTAEALVQLQDSIDNIQLTAGPQGADGANGTNGVDGKSAYDLYKDTIDEHDAVPAIYSFTSFGTESGVEYGTGKVKVISQDATSTIVEVTENNPYDANAADFVGQQFKINSIELDANPIELFTLEDIPTGISVNAVLFSEAQPAVVAMTELEWLASLRGANGVQGAQGAQGPQGERGADGAQGATGSFDASALEDYATKEYVGQQIADVVGTAPEALNTLQEIAEILDNDESAAGGIIQQIDGIKTSLENYATKAQIGNLGNIIDVEGQEAVYYTQEEADAYNNENDLQEGDEGFVTTETIKTAAVPEESHPATVQEYVDKLENEMIANERVTAAALADLNNAIDNISLTPGPQGSQGSQGIQGADGTNGSQGPQGTPGENGSQGPQGDQGAQGEQGNQGPQGEQGAPGENGSQGPQGDQGAQGEQGNQGPQGDQGAPGSFDASALEDYATKEYVTEVIGGIQGGQGTQGEQGPQGDQGAPGENGSQGPQGDQGAPGSFDASALADYATKEYVTEVLGGIQGGQGVVGAQGPQGDQGAPGENGSQGPQGDQGAPGSFDASALADYATKEYVTEVLGGIQGGQGVVGAQGPQGDQGAPGENGSQGPQGDQGAPGENGSQGPQGDQGAPGTNGSQGPQGDQGAPGENGSQGPQGDQGAPGTNGSQGPQGDQGAPGTNGSQGPQGDQGPQGATGSFDASALADYVTTTALNTKIGNLGNKVEAAPAVYEAVESGTTLTSGDTYYTSDAGAGEFTSDGSEVADGTNYFILVSEAVTAVPYASVIEVITDNEEVTATALTDLQAKYEALLARVAALEGNQGVQA